MEQVVSHFGSYSSLNKLHEHHDYWWKDGCHILLHPRSIHVFWLVSIVSACFIKSLKFNTHFSIRIGGFRRHIVLVISCRFDWKKTQSWALNGKLIGNQQTSHEDLQHIQCVSLHHQELNVHLFWLGQNASWQNEDIIGQNLRPPNFLWVHIQSFLKYCMNVSPKCPGVFQRPLVGSTHTTRPSKHFHR